MTHAVIYAAKSTEDKHGSIPTQLEDCCALAEREGWTVLDEFVDEAFSAYSGNRGPGLEQAKALAASTAAEHGTCILVAQDSDRFARGAGDAPGAAEHLGEVYFQMKRQSVELWTVRSRHLDLLRATLEGERSHDESARKSQAVSAGMKRAAAGGRALGIKSLGYRVDPDKNNDGIVVLEREAELVRRIFREFISGQSFTAIARNLQRDGVPTRNGGIWRQSTVAGILRNRVYVGEVTCKGETFAGNHDPIIDTETFEKAQQLLAARPSKGRGRPPAGRHLFRSGMLRCGFCGEAMAPRSDGPGEGWYYCNGRGKLGKEFCATPHIRRVDVDSSVFAYFEKVGLDVEATRAQVASARDSRLAEVRSLIQTATRAEREASEALVRVKRDYTRGAISAEDWSELRPDLESESAGAVAELARLRDQERDVLGWAESRDAEAETLRKLAQIRSAIAGEVKDAEGVDAVRAALLRLFERFVVYVDVETGQGRIEAIVRHDAIRTVDEQLRPILRPTALGIAGPTTDAKASSCAPRRGSG
jgi:DNA invertase Pin-like site-specific DNA recombinase